jgi:hypothetical protein
MKNSEEMQMRQCFEVLQKVMMVTPKNEKTIADNMKSIVESLVISEKSTNGCYEYISKQRIH